MSEHEDYAAPPPSPRHKLCVALAAWMKAHGLSDGLDGRHPEGRYRYCEWAKAGVGRGQVSVYSEKYVRVWWRATVPGLPPEGDRVLPGLAEAWAFVHAAFVDLDAAKALAVPTYQYKRGPRAPDTVPAAAPARPAPAEAPAGTAYEVPADFFGSPGREAPRPEGPPADDLTGLFDWDDL